MNIYLRLRLLNAERTIHLEGSGVQPPVQGTFYQPGAAAPGPEDSAELVSETLRISCSGTRDAVLGLQEALNELFSILRHLQPGGAEALFLVVEYESGNAWQSRIVHGCLRGCSAGIAARESGADILTLGIERLNYWEKTAASTLLLSNRHGTLQPILTIDNAADNAHDNFVDIALGSASGDLPAPLELILTNMHSGRQVESVWIGQWNSDGCALPSWKPVYEGEAASAGPGVTLSAVADASSSAGQFGRLAWNAAAEQRLASFPLAADHMSGFNGKFYKPLVRLSNNHTYADLWIKGRMTYGAAHTCAYDTGWVLCPPGQPWMELEALRLPPNEAYGGFFEQMYLSLYAMKSTPAAVVLDVDFVLLLPTDGYNRLHMITPVSAGYQVREGEALGSCQLNISTSYASPSHARQGNRLYINPWSSSRLFFAHRSGSSWLVDTQLSVALSYSPRKRSI